MPIPQAVSVTVSTRQRAILKSLERRRSLAVDVATRCRIVLASAEGVGNNVQAAALDGHEQLVRRWRRRWADAESALAKCEAEGVSDADLEMRILAVFADRPRSGTPPKFTPEVIVKIIALACEPPSDSELAVSHWSTSELAREAIKRGIVTSVSPRQVGRFLARRT